MGISGGQSSGRTSGSYKSVADRLRDVYQNYVGSLFSSEWAEEQIQHVVENINDNVDRGFWDDSDISEQIRSINNDFQHIEDLKESGVPVNYAE